MIEKVFKVVLHFMMFGISFYCLSGVDFAKFFLKTENKVFKAQMLLMLMSLALGFLASQFVLAIMFKL